MKVLSFTCRPDDKTYLESVLPALLNRTKTQTIRPAFCKDCGTEVHYRNRKDGKGTEEVHKPRFKIGESIQLMWKQRNSPKGAIFCKCHGLYENKPPLDNPSIFTFDPANTFPKILGFGVITELFNISDFEERDGFKPMEMFGWFDRQCKISESPKQFWVYRWDWLP